MNQRRYRKGNPHRLYRDREHAVLAGVCAGVADFFGGKRLFIRFIFIIMTPFVAFLNLPAYLILAFALKPKPDDLYQTSDQEHFWRQVSSAPGHTFGELRHRLRELDLDLQKVENYVTSKEFQLDSELKEASSRPCRSVK